MPAIEDFDVRHALLDPPETPGLQGNCHHNKKNVLIGDTYKHVLTHFRLYSNVVVKFTTFLLNLIVQSEWVSD